MPEIRFLLNLFFFSASENFERKVSFYIEQLLPHAEFRVLFVCWFLLAANYLHVVRGCCQFSHPNPLSINLVHMCGLSESSRSLPAPPSAREIDIMHLHKLLQFVSFDVGGFFVCSNMWALPPGPTEGVAQARRDTLKKFQSAPTTFMLLTHLHTCGTVMSRLEMFAHQVISAINAGGHVGNFNMVRIKHESVRVRFCTCVDTHNCCLRLWRSNQQRRNNGKNEAPSPGQA